MPNMTLFHRGIRYERTKIADAMGRREKVFADAWEKYNEPRQHFAFCRDMSFLEANLNDGQRFIPVAQETATAVATKMQWLGSPLGFQYLEETLREAGYALLSKDTYEKLHADLRAARAAKTA